MHAKHADSARLNGLSGQVIGCTFTVLTMLGAGFVGRVCEPVPCVRRGRLIVGMTGALPVCQPFRGLVVRRETDKE
jgi:hypothetical protein